MSTAGNGAGSAILTRLDALEKKIDRLLAHLGANGSASGNSGTQTGNAATVAQIKGERGDPKIRMVPKSWHGESYKGMLASECSPDFLEVYAEQLDWFASKNEDPKKAGWDRLDAARCRRWAIEIREGRHKARPRETPAAMPPPGDDYDPSATVWDAGTPPPPDDGDAGFGSDDMPF